MTQFHDGQEVEVTRRDPEIPNWNWRKAKIIGVPGDKNQFLVRFSDGTRAVFDADHIRSVDVDLDFREDETQTEHIDRLISEGY